MTRKDELQWMLNIIQDRISTQTNTLNEQTNNLTSMQESIDTRNTIINDPDVRDIVDSEFFDYFFTLNSRNFQGFYTDKDVNELQGSINYSKKRLETLNSYKTRLTNMINSL